MRRGHRVLFVTANQFCPTIREAGFAATAGGLHPDDPLPAPFESKPYARDYGYPALAAKVHDLVGIAETTSVDLIIRDPTDLAAVAAGEVLGLPCVTLGFSEFIPPSSWHILAGTNLDSVRQEWGIPPDPDWSRMHPNGYLNLMPPPLLENCDLVVGSRPLRPICRQSLHPPTVPEWLDDLPNQPVVHVTFGSVYNDDTERMGSIVNWIADAGVTVVCTFGPDRHRPPAGLLSKHTTNAHFEPYVALSEVLKRSDAVVTAGGFNTVMGALEYGLPMLVLPRGADQPTNARAVSSVGAGVWIDPQEVTQETILDGVRAVLRGTFYRTGAARMQEFIERMPGPDCALDYLETLVG
jgi:UDP:flavonoid glycosyltransferase YjiC (YdhE family)